MSRPRLRRRVRSEWVLLAILGLLGLAGAGESYRAAHKPPPKQPDRPYNPDWQRSKHAPDFELPDARGTRHRLSDLVQYVGVLTFVSDDRNSRELERYLGMLQRAHWIRAVYITVADFPPQEEPRFRQYSGLQQTILYETKDGPVAHLYKSDLRPRVFVMGRGLVLWDAGPSPAEDSIYHIGTSVAGALHFESPNLERVAHPAPKPNFLDHKVPAYPPLDAGRSGGR